MRFFLKGLKALTLATKHKVLVFQGDGWSCGFQSLHLIMQVVDHRGPLADLFFTPMPQGFVPYMLSALNADRSVWIIKPTSEVFKGVQEVDDLALPTPSVPNDTPSDLAPFSESTNPTTADDVFLFYARFCSSAAIPY